MISTGLAVFLILYVIYSLVMLSLVIRTYRRLSFLSKLEINSSSEFPGFTRDDYSKWSACQLFFGALFLLPARLISALVLLTLLYLIQNFLCIIFCNFSFKKGMNRCHKFLSNLIVRLTCRSMMFLGGIYWISYQKQQPRDYNVSYFHNVGEVPHATCVSNHITWVDILFYLAHPTPFGFISNESVQDFCFIGPIARLIGCIFVDRKSPESKKKCFEDLKRRVDNIKQNPKGESRLSHFD